ncbi:hypothetical protein Taro_056532 [Colocasia esculenta]|uniref:EF-hand domain-containing protein n=1 Tax=Colocasia esculenta TaxID=4460 RepID=A0A843XU80_COLES|nr:hypothetical protein [Colocasia esculenta]
MHTEWCGGSPCPTPAAALWSAVICIEQLFDKTSFDQEECKSCKRLVCSIQTWFTGVGEPVCSADDIEVAMSLDWGPSDERIKNKDEGKCRDCRLLEGIIQLLKNKEETIEERKSFSIPDELQMVMCKLGSQEGTELENCQKMIQVVDKDGKGMIDFSEFKEMMENAI